MPIINPQDAREVDQQIERIFDAGSTADRLERIRQLFVGILDFHSTFNFSVGLSGARDEVILPAEAYLVARLDDVQVVYVDMSESEIGTDRVNKREAQEAARLIESEFGDELLLVFTNRKSDHLHFVYPSFEGRQPSLRRMVVEKGLPRRTLVQQISNIWANWQVSGDIRRELDAAFDVEAVTRRFFTEYKLVFNGAMEKVTGFDGDHDAKNLYVQTLFNRLMFVYFISRKGWLEFEGNYEYLDAVWRDYDGSADQDNFYESRLSPLFFEGLNNPFNREVTSIDPTLRASIGSVPFLNGGLFEKTEFDRRDGVVVPDDAVRPILTQLFDRFNFTVMESTPLDVEVAVDPEMLGKVFEELVTGRHESGSYYTPRPVVSFMCREALKGYLNARVGAADEAKIARFVDEHSTRGIKINAARQIAAALESVKVIDPACGSGAYLLGMMQELIELQTTLFRAGVNSKELYELKLQIIRDNLYGVDIDEFAVNITMLRLWLSLAIDITDTWPEPLPNLEFKILRGDSLLGPDPSPENLGELSSHWIRELDVVRLKSDYMYAHDPKEKMLLRARVDSTQEKIRGAFGDAVLSDDVVDWRVNFAEVFAGAGGFDVVVANPPYVRQEKIGTTKAELRRVYKDSSVARSDLYCYFYVRALQLLRAGGVQVFVCSNSWLDVGYGAKLQEHLLKNARVDAVYESAVERQFSTAQINTIISVISKSLSEVDEGIRFVSLRDEFEVAISDASKRRDTLMSKAELMGASLGSPDAQGRRKFVGDKWGAKYLRAPDIYRAVMAKGEGKLVRLSDLVAPKFGVKTGANDFFLLNEQEIAHYGLEDEFLAPVMTSPRESRSVMVNASNLGNKLFVCDRTKDELAGSAALNYIERGEAEGSHERRSVIRRRLWYNLGLGETAEIAMNYVISSTARTFFVKPGTYFINVFHVLPNSDIDASKLCTTMNSTLSQLMLNLNGRANLGGGALKVELYELGSVPVVNPANLPAVNHKVFASTDWDVLSPSPERMQIDDAVFDVLGLTQGERDGVYEGVRELVENRMRRARSV